MQVIINDIFPYTQAVAILGQTVYSTNFTANAASDVIVYSTPFGNAPNDVTQILASNQYSVAFVGSGNIVQVTLVTPSAAGDVITITRQTPADYLNLYSNTNFTPSMLNNDFGILTLVDQQAQLVNQLIAPRYNYSALITDVVDTILPVLQANQIWIKNSSNTGIIAVDLSAASSGTVDVGLANELAYYQVNGNTVSGLPTANNGVLITSSLGVPSISSTLPSAVQLNISELGMQTQNLNMGNFLINNLATPLVATDAATKGYADSIAAGLNPIEGVQAASTVNLTVTYNNGSSGVGATITNADTQAAWVIDGYTVQVGDRILIKNQTSTFQNGIYVATNVGSNSTNWVATRASDYNSSSNINKGDLTSVVSGAQMGSSWIQTQTITTVGTDAILFSPFFLPANYVSSALTSGSIYVGNASNIATGVAMSGDATLANTGAITVTKTSGTAFGPAATALLGQLPGTTTNDSASAGNIGQFISSVIAAGSAISVTNGINFDLTSISLPAGDWDVWGNLTAIPTIGAQSIYSWISATSATTPDSSLYSGLGAASAIFSTTTSIPPKLRFSLSTTTTIYLTGQVGFPSGTCTAVGAIYARRRR